MKTSLRLRLMTSRQGTDTMMMMIVIVNVMMKTGSEALTACYSGKECHVTRT